MATADGRLLRWFGARCAYELTPEGVRAQEAIARADHADARAALAHVESSRPSRDEADAASARFAAELGEDVREAAGALSDAVHALDTATGSAGADAIEAVITRVVHPATRCGEAGRIAARLRPANVAAPVAEALAEVRQNLATLEAHASKLGEPPIPPSTAARAIGLAWVAAAFRAVCPLRATAAGVAHRQKI